MEDKDPGHNSKNREQGGKDFFVNPANKNESGTKREGNEQQHDNKNLENAQKKVANEDNKDKLAPQDLAGANQGNTNKASQK